MPIDLPPEKPEPKCVPDPESHKLEDLVDDIVDGTLYGAGGFLMFLLFTILSPLTDWEPHDRTIFRISALLFMSVGCFILYRRDLH